MEAGAETGLPPVPTPPSPARFDALPPGPSPQPPREEQPASAPTSRRAKARSPLSPSVKEAADSEDDDDSASSSSASSAAPATRRSQRASTRVGKQPVAAADDDDEDQGESDSDVVEVRRTLRPRSHKNSSSSAASSRSSSSSSESDPTEVRRRSARSRGDSRFRTGAEKNEDGGRVYPTRGSDSRGAAKSSRNSSEKDLAAAADSRKRSRASPEAASEVSGAEEEEEEEEHDPEEEDVEYEDSAPVDVELILGRALKTKEQWEEIMSKMNTSKVSVGSRWINDDDEADEDENGEDDDVQIVGEEKKVERFLIKWRGLAYIHVSWETADDLRNESVQGCDKKALPQLNRRLREAPFVDDGAYGSRGFNPDFAVIDRVLQIDPTGGVNNEACYLVKWTGLGYDDATWETASDLPTAELDLALKKLKARKTPPKSVKQLLQGISRRPDVPQTLTESPVFKKGQTLRSYQVEAVNWLMFNWALHRNSILADEMGLGKTCQTVAFVQRVAQGPTLVIAPLATIPHWQREFESWTDLNVIVYHGTEAARKLIRDHEFFHKSQAKSKSWFAFDVCVTTYEIALADTAYLCKAPYSILVIDEAHRIKNRNSKLTKALGEFSFDSSLLLTGTPIQNNTSELWTLLNFTDPERFSDLEEFESRFSKMTTAGQMDEFHDVLKPYLLRRFKSDVEASLPPKEELVIEVELTKVQRVFYRAIYEENVAQLKMGVAKGSRVNMNNIAMQLRKTCCHPYLIDGVEDQALKTVPVAPGVSYQDHVMQLLINSSGKFILLDKLLPRLKEQNHRVLIFSQFTRVLDVLEDYMGHRNFSYERIDGSVSGSKRQEAIDRYSAPGSKTFCFLLSTRGCGQGINLTAADTVIMFDCDWNPQNDVQALARCHRIGQTKPVSVYRLVTSKTYEQEMFSRASLKLGLDTAIMARMAEDATKPSSDDENEGAPSGVTDEELEHMLKYGAYAIAKEGDETEATAFCEADIDQILKTRTTKVANTASQAAEQSHIVNKFSKASFVIPGAEQEVDLTDPQFWNKVLGEAVVAQQEREAASPERLGKGRRRRGNVNYQMTQSSDSSSGSDNEDEAAGNKAGGGNKGDNDSDSTSSTSDFNATRSTHIKHLTIAMSIFPLGQWKEIAQRAGDYSDVDTVIRAALGMTLVTLVFRVQQFMGESGLPQVTSSTADADVLASVKDLYEVLANPEKEVQISPYITTRLFMSKFRAELAKSSYIATAAMVQAAQKFKPNGMLMSMCEIVHVADFVERPRLLHDRTRLHPMWTPADDAALLKTMAKYGFERRRTDHKSDWEKYFADESLGWTNKWQAVTEVKDAMDVDVRKIGPKITKIVAGLVNMQKDKLPKIPMLPGDVASAIASSGGDGKFAAGSAAAASSKAVMANRSGGLGLGTPKLTQEWTKKEVDTLVSYLLRFGNPHDVPASASTVSLFGKVAPPSWAMAARLLGTKTEDQVVEKAAELVQGLSSVTQEKSATAEVSANKLWGFTPKNVLSRLRVLASFWQCLNTVSDDVLLICLGDKYRKFIATYNRGKSFPAWWLPQHDFALIKNACKYGVGVVCTQDYEIFGPSPDQDWGGLAAWPGRAVLNQRVLTMLELVALTVRMPFIYSEHDKERARADGRVLLSVPTLNDMRARMVGLVNLAPKLPQSPLAALKPAKPVVVAASPMRVLWHPVSQPSFSAAASSQKLFATVDLTNDDDDDDEDLEMPTGLHKGGKRMTLPFREQPPTKRLSPSDDSAAPSSAPVLPSSGHKTTLDDYFRPSTSAAKQIPQVARPSPIVKHSPGKQEPLR